MNKVLYSVLFSFIFILLFSCNSKSKEEMELMDFIKKHEEKVKELFSNTNRSYFKATISGKKEDYSKYAKLNLKYNKIYTNKEDFKKLENLINSNKVKEPLLKRQLDVLYRSYKGNQISEELLEETITLQTKLESIFSTYRVKYNGKEVTDNEVDRILKESVDSNELESVWKASKEIGKLVEDDFKKLIKLRNKIAKELAYENYQLMSLDLAELDPSELEKIFNELDSLTKPTFLKLKKDMDVFLSKRYAVGINQLKPWHYQNKYFQDAPDIYPVDFDKYYKGEDIINLTREFYNGIGLNIDRIIDQSDLYEKKGKYQHAYCSNIDRDKDIRIVCNTKDNHYWMSTNLHEFGHGVYDYYLCDTLPWVLKEPAHIFTTEAVAMMFDRLASNPSWISQFIKDKSKLKDIDSIKNASYESLRLEKMVFSRWAQTVYRFEKELYKNPDQDLNKLWWNIVEKYQMLKKPDGRNMPDYASKIHIVLYPVYYQNYLLGDILASQIQYKLHKNYGKAKDINLETFKGNVDVGKFMLKMFKMGNKYHWNEMIELLTGEKLTAKYYAKQFVD